MAPAEPNHKPFQVQGELPVFEEEREGWKGYIEWERYPEKKKAAAEIMAKYDFPVVISQNLRLTSIDQCSLQNSSSSHCRRPTQY